MGEIVLNAIQRTVRSGKFNEIGFIPGVLYGEGVEKPNSVKFNELALKKILSNHGANAKIWVNFDSNKVFGFIKEIQRAPVTMKLVHIDVQLVSKNQEVKMQIPINFKGNENLNPKQLNLHITKLEIDVVGNPTLMPDSVDIDVSEKNLGDTITSKDFTLDPALKISGSEDEIYATITYLKGSVNTEASGTAGNEKA
jgi:large subunit ribosomal protein L25